MFQRTFVEKIKTHILCSVTFYFFENRAAYEIMWKTILEPDRTQMKIWRLRIACSIPKATDAYSEQVTHVACLLQQWVHEPALTLRTLAVLLYILTSLQ